jgi:hypothetical protein
MLNKFEVLKIEEGGFPFQNIYITFYHFKSYAV